MKNIFVIFFFLLIGCAVKKENIESSIDVKNDLVDVVEEQTEANISFVIKNKSDGDLKLYQPERLSIEYFDGTNWVKLRILPCPCDAPCARPEEYIIIDSGKEFIMNWNKTESWCGDRKSDGVRETLSQKVKVGKYRIRLLYSINEEKDNRIINKEFQI